MKCRNAHDATPTWKFAFVEFRAIELNSCKGDRLLGFLRESIISAKSDISPPVRYVAASLRSSLSTEPSLLTSPSSIILRSR